MKRIVSVFAAVAAFGLCAADAGQPQGDVPFLDIGKFSNMGFAGDYAGAAAALRAAQGGGRERNPYLAQRDQRGGKGGGLQHPGLRSVIHH